MRETFFVAGWCGVCKRFLRGEISQLPRIVLKGKIAVKPTHGLVNLVTHGTPHDALRAAEKAHEKAEIRKLVRKK